ncbi:MAG TPA: threonine--tRNA ligase [Candidatus Polarisedimenticolaceae bacterium]|nr:threonine--tRNA ligase [Candidatus Polarisedimenticolaceae bacterium]
MPETIATVHVTLPDGSVRAVPHGTTPREVAASIGPRLAKDAVVAKANGVLVDLSRPLLEDVRLEILTAKSPEALEVLRHSTAHATAQAVQELFPGTKIGQGPVIENGFYYDFDRDQPFTDADLATIEARVREIIGRNLPIERLDLPKSEAIAFFTKEQEPYKIYFATTKGDDVVSIYRQGSWTDFCRGPHVPSTGRLGAFKLLSVAGAYWLGSEKNKMLQRIYGTAFFTQADLDRYLHLLEEARKRDHRKLGKELDLFMFHPYAPGAAFWTERGTIVVNLLNAYLRELQQADYREIKTPLLYNRHLWELSGHWGKYRENMFLVLDKETGEHDFSLKPMNCPSHYLYYNAKTHSYRELPLRFVTYDVLHRNEVSGSLSGLTRVRQFQQDDCHVFLRQDQIETEVKRLADFILAYYKTFGLTATLKFATRPEVRIGDDAMWDRAEGALKAALESTGLPYEIKPGDGAFYGPKIDFDVADSLGRKWQLGTIQLDYAAPDRFKLEYVGEDNSPHRPVVIHRAVSGSFERFIAILIEHYAGAFPLWLAPEQVRVLPITDRINAYAEDVRAKLAEAGLRVRLDDRGEKIGAKIRDAQLQQIPFMLVLGDREAENGTVAVRSRRAGDEGALPVDAFLARAITLVKTKSNALSLDQATETPCPS